MSGVTVVIYNEDLIPQWELNIDSVLSEQFTYPNETGSAVNDEGFNVSDGINLGPVEYILHVLVDSAGFNVSPLYVGELDTVTIPKAGLAREIAYAEAFQLMRGKLLDITCLRFGILKSMTLNSHDFMIESKSGYEITANFSEKQFGEAVETNVTLTIKRKSKGGKVSMEVGEPEFTDGSDNKKPDVDTLAVDIQQAAAAFKEVIKLGAEQVDQAVERTVRPSQFKRNKKK